MITIRETAVLDDRQRRVIRNIEPFTTGLDMIVTRGHSSPRDQLRTIGQYAEINGIHFPEFDAEIADMSIIVDIPTAGRVKTWQRTWSRLLERGVIINPPQSAICLFPYRRRSGEQMQGKVIHPSPHIKEIDDPAPCPVDFSARINGIPNIVLAAKILTKAKDAGAGIRYVRPEPRNTCVHLDLG